MRSTNLTRRYKEEAMRYKLYTTVLCAALILAAGIFGISSLAARGEQKLVERYFYDDSANDNYILGEYNWCLYDSNGNRNDLTVEDIRLVVEQSKKYNIPDVVSLGVLMASSDGYSYLKDAERDALGMYQITYDDGKAYYDKYMSDGTEYIHSDNLNSAFNIELGVTMLGEMYKSNESLFGAIQEYRGTDDVAEFTSKINKFLGRKGLKLSDYIFR